MLLVIQVGIGDLDRIARSRVTFAVNSLGWDFGTNNLKHGGGPS